ncbi:hypothetical protein GPECTOR_14g159 [Gonium pectorale]|uniref:Uncharacterized protein n=1 Tax=Gonium pectorale TaxID=33097 RepID=A0A150GMB3_GONPE|nr:hypothetical protein GPECTOR_14g159 [Gonium pectorale]|eukprot:KXZ50912.1 hypothetical protein GPECTOR_14g159 [Gonium pectorale]
MGSCCAARCFNAPHTWQLGWDAPLATLSETTLRPGRTVAYSLKAPPVAPATLRRPTPSSSSGSFLRINAGDWAGEFDPDIGGLATIWIAFRTNVAPYDNLPYDKPANVSVYWYPGAEPTDYSRSLLLVTLAPGGVWRDDRLQLSVRWQALSSTGAGPRADVRICHYTEPVERSCGDNIDNDCDGLVDKNDPDCQVDYGPPPWGEVPDEPATVPHATVPHATVPLATISLTTITLATVPRATISFAAVPLAAVAFAAATGSRSAL